MERETLKNAGEMSDPSLLLACVFSVNDSDHSTIPSGGKGQVTR